MTIIYLLLRLVSIVSVILCGVYDKPVFAMVVILIMIVYSIISIKTSNGDSLKLESQADQVYFVGYLSTISAFSVIVLKIYVSNGVTELRIILLMTGVALLTTVFGLLAMTTLKDYAQSLEEIIIIPNVTNNIDINDTSKETENEKLQELIDQVQNLGGFPQIYEISKQSTETIARLNEQLVDLKTKISNLDDSVISLKLYVDGGSDSAEKFKNNIYQLQSVIDDFVKLLQSRLYIDNKKTINDK